MDMADENTQVLRDWAGVNDDEKPVSALIHHNNVDGVGLAGGVLTFEDNDEATASPRKKWKRDVLSPQHKADLQSEPSKPDASPIKKKPAGAERVFEVCKTSESPRGLEEGKRHHGMFPSQSFDCEHS